MCLGRYDITIRVSIASHFYTVRKLDEETKEPEMITIQESQDLMQEFIKLRASAKEGTTEAVTKFQRFERLCIEKFSYLVTMKTNRYRGFSNYEDLNQEGFVALLNAMKNYSPKKGLWFYWAHYYIGTRISRQASLHTAIRYPLKVAKEIIPHRESQLPLLIEERFCPDKDVEELQTSIAIQTGLGALNEEQKTAVSLAFGFDGGDPLSVSKICKKLNISRTHCIRLLKISLAILRENIKL
jgi:RNA polymerase sigma factor (sigma-70 family)